MEFVAAYLAVEQARFGAQLKVEIAVDRAADQAFVPAMVLQVLVENAIKHGVSAVPGVGEVVVRGTEGDGRLHLEVRDNGPGGNIESTNGTGFGLRNIRDRLRLYFGGKAEVSLQRDNGMTSVRIEMPAVTSLTSLEQGRT